MKYDKYVAEETKLNCINQDMLNYILEAYAERVLHELNLLK